MGSTCSSSNTIHKLETNEYDPHSLAGVLSSFSSLYTSVKTINTRYLCCCLVRSGFRGLGFVICDGDDVWGREVDLNYLQSLKTTIDNGDPTTWENIIIALKKSFQESRIAIDMSEDKSKCYVRIDLPLVKCKSNKVPNIRLKLKVWTDEEARHALLCQYFLIPLYEYYAVRTETMPRQRIEELQKQLDLYKSELQFLEQAGKKTSIMNHNNSSGNIGSMSGMNILENGIRSQAQVSKFLTALKKRLIQSNLINEQEHEALTAVINHLNQDTIYRYEVNKANEKKIDLEVMAWLKNRFEAEGPDTRRKRDLATVDANSFIKNIDVSSIEKTKTRQDIISMFDKVNDWNFDVFKLRDLTDGQTLFITSYTLFVKYDLLRKFSIPEDVLVNFLSEVQGGYHTNPYHNSMHAADVLQVFHFIVAKGGLGDYLSDEDILAGLTSCIIHDYDHPGLNNAFQINTQSYLATLYNDRAVLENHHCAQAFELMRSSEFNIFQNLTREQNLEVRETVIDMVLATDMGQHSKIVGKFKNLIEGGSTFGSKTDVRVALEIAIKIADVSNPIRPRKLYLKWAHRISEEFYNQGDKERELGLEISPFMDRTKPSLNNLQIAFITYLVVPMIDSYCIFLPKMDFCRNFLQTNKGYWSTNTIIQEEDMLNDINDFEDSSLI